MKYILIVIVFVFLTPIMYAQIKTIPSKNKVPISQTDSLSSQKISRSQTKSSESNIKDYKIITYKRDTIFLDTTLTIQKEYKYNYLRKDNFNLIQFANTGQTYNTLSFNPFSNKIKPLFSAQARHFNYIKYEDINYYNVPTPLTELYFKTVFAQGQNLDAFFTVNTSKEFNFSIAYKGLRSLGNYQNALTSTGNFRFTTNYKTKNERYRMRGHITIQDLFNQENGGITDDDVLRFINNEEEIKDRSVFDPNFQNADNVLEGKRFVLEQSYDIFKKKDSVKTSNLSIHSKISFQDKFYEYNQSDAANTFLGTSFTNVIEDRVTLEDFYADLGVSFKKSKLGDLGFSINYNNINYGYNSLVNINSQIIANRIKEDFFGFQGTYKNNIGKLSFGGSFGANLSDVIKGNFLNGSLAYQISNQINLEAGLNVNSSLPNYNLLLNQSGYTNYNWDNKDTFDTVNSQQLSVAITSKKYGSLSLDVTNIDNYSFFDLEDIQNEIKVIKPSQYNKSIQYLRLEAKKEFRLGKFALDNTIMYQNVTSEDNVLNVPTIITRNAFYYTDEVFKKALKFQTGIILNYFTEYNGNGYDPLLSEFYTQNQTKIGGFPRLDFFINAKVRQTRIYLKAEHFNSSFTGYDYFSAPNNPYRDFTVRFGLVWNFFL